MNEDKLALVVYLAIVLFGVPALFLWIFLLWNSYDINIVFFGLIFCLCCFFPAIITLIALKFRWSKYINRFFDSFICSTALLLVFLILASVTSYYEADVSGLVCLFALIYAVTYFAIIVKKYMKKDIIMLIVYFAFLLLGILGFIFLYIHLVAFARICGKSGGNIPECGSIFVDLLFIIIPLLYLTFPAILTLIALKFRWSKYINWFFNNLLYPTILLIFILFLTFNLKIIEMWIFLAMPLIITYLTICCRLIIKKAIEKSLKS